MRDDIVQEHHYRQRHQDPLMDVILRQGEKSLKYAGLVKKLK